MKSDRKNGQTVWKPAAALMLAAGLLGACGGSSGEASASNQEEKAPTTRLEIVAYDFGYEIAPATIPAGQIETVLTNEGHQPHQALIYRINDGITFEEFKKQVMADDSLVPKLAKGGIDGVSEVIGNGGETLATGDQLTPGNYGVLCFVRDQSLKSTKNHAELGMIAPLTVE